MLVGLSFSADPKVEENQECYDYYPGNTRDHDKGRLKEFIIDNGCGSGFGSFFHIICLRLAND